jgi:hypothetical protein
MIDLPSKEAHVRRENMWRNYTAVVVGLALLGTLTDSWQARAQQSATEVQAQAPAPARAQQTEIQTQGPAASGVVAPEEKGPNTGRVGLVLGADWASAYYFRGIVNEQNGGNNVQPYGEIGFRLLENMGPLSSLSVGAGFWNNWHYGGGTIVEPTDPKWWYEADVYVKLSATWWEALTTGVTYTWYTSPNRGVHVVCRRRALRQPE